MQNSTPLGNGSTGNSVTRIRVWHGLLILCFAIVVLRLFYLQVIRHNHYQTAALQGQMREYEIPAQRGVVEAHNGDEVVPIVLNEFKYTLFADPKFVTDTAATALAIEQVIGGQASGYQQAIEAGERYAVLAKKLTKEQKTAIEKAAEDEARSLRGQADATYKWKGIGTREVPYRTYPQGSLAAQLLGFVNDEGVGKYGIEQALDSRLQGKPGALKAITDANGVPLAANRDNVLVEPKPGERVTLTIDIGLQQLVEESLKAGLDRARSPSGSALVLEAKTGAVKAMANYPSYNPGEFFKIEDGALFANPVVSSPLEIGSIMKPLTAAAGIDQGVINKDSSYNDPGSYNIDGSIINNIEEDRGRGQRNIADVLQKSLNTGATWMLMQMGGGQINQQARQRWHAYMTDHYRFGQATGVEQGYEEKGSVPDPNDGYALNLQFANTSFGQGMSANLLQVAGAYAAVLNGGTYYQPHLVEKSTSASGETVVTEPKVVRQNVVKPSAGQAVRELMEYVVSQNYQLYGIAKPRSEYSVGGKTGTAQLVKPGGGYYDDLFNGTFAGFVGGNDVQYIIVVKVDQPGIPGYAGSKAAAPLFGDIIKLMIDNFGVTPKS